TTVVNQPPSIAHFLTPKRYSFYYTLSFQTIILTKRHQSRKIKVITKHFEVTNKRQIIKWRILSTAGIAQKEFIPAMQQVDNAELIAISSLSGQARSVADRFGIKHAYDSYEELLDNSEIDAGYIPLPNHLRKEWAIKAAEKKRH